MPAFFPDVLEEFSTCVFLEEVHRKFHYEKAQMNELQEVAHEMLPLLWEEAFWERKASLLPIQYRPVHSAVQYENVAMSLGKGVDDLQEHYSRKGLLSKGYMLEALASELLRRGYAAYNFWLRENEGWYAAKYHFPGSEEAFPLELLPQIVKELTPKITCNQAFCMFPTKSVVFISELTREEKVSCAGVCTGCTRVCAFRDV